MWTDEKVKPFLALIEEKNVTAILDGKQPCNSTIYRDLKESMLSKVGPYDFRDNENADRITESDNKNGIYRFFYFILFIFLLYRKVLKVTKLQFKTGLSQ